MAGAGDGVEGPEVDSEKGNTDSSNVTSRETYIRPVERSRHL